MDGNRCRYKRLPVHELHFQPPTNQLTPPPFHICTSLSHDEPLVVVPNTIRKNQDPTFCTWVETRSPHVLEYITNTPNYPLPSPLPPPNLQYLSTLSLCALSTGKDPPKQLRHSTRTLHGGIFLYKKGRGISTIQALGGMLSESGREESLRRGSLPSNVRKE